MEQNGNKAIELAEELAQRYGIASLAPLLESCRRFAERDELSVAVVGRFKAGKSTFLNHLIGRDLLPVGVIPVTSVVTELVHGMAERAVIHFLSGEANDVPLGEIRSYVAESGNPGNEKRVSRVVIELPALARFRRLRFVDMPGLESVLAHNTAASLDWLPNVALALLAVSVDPPLTQQDVSLLENLYEYTPKVSILLTKVDLIDEAQCGEVIAFVRAQLDRQFGSAPEIFPYSARDGFGPLKAALEETLIRRTLGDLAGERAAILSRKLDTLLRECDAYLSLALKSAEALQSERAALARQVTGEKETLEEEKLQLRLLIKHASGGARAEISKRFDLHEKELCARLLDGLRAEFPSWTRSLKHVLESYELWLEETLTRELQALSVAERTAIIRPVEQTSKQVFRALQNFRDRLSERAVRAFGVPLRTTEVEIEVAEPMSPDIRVGRVFDRNWELLSAVVPMRLVRRLVLRHFARRIPGIVETNLSRLTTQWEESVNAALHQIGIIAATRFDELIETVERLTQSKASDAPQLRSDLERVRRAAL